MTPRPGIRGLLLGATFFVFAMPLAAIVLLRVFDDQLIRRTEARLIAEAILIAEAYTEALGDVREGVPSTVRERASFHAPIEPMLSLGQGVLPPTPDPRKRADTRDGPAWRAGRRIDGIVRRAGPRNLSSARVLGPDGCVVASSGAQLGDCLDDLPEVARALGGDYAAVLRERTAESATNLGPFSRRGRVRVHVAVPIVRSGEVLGAVRMSRTALDPAKALWFDRRRLGVALLVCGAVAAGVALLLSRALSRPLRDVTRAAQASARGEPHRPAVSSDVAVSELVEMRRAVDTMNEQLTARAEYVAEFAANTSHELKTPIAAIRGASELLEHHWRDMPDADRAMFIGHIADDARRMERLVSGLLELARIENATTRPPAIDPSPVLRAVTERFGASVRLRDDTSGCSVRVLPEHLETAVANLIDNAVRHGGGDRVDVVAGADGGSGLRVSVRDEGPGISPGNRERVFDRFFTTRRDRGGTGLGLSIAAAVAERAGGSLTLRTDGEGTVFELVFRGADADPSQRNFTKVSQVARKHPVLRKFHSAAPASGRSSP